MEMQEILAIYGTEYKEMTKTLLKEADLEGRILKKERKIGIKPNLVALQKLPTERLPTVKLWQEL